MISTCKEKKNSSSLGGELENFANATGREKKRGGPGRSASKGPKIHVKRERGGDRCGRDGVIKISLKEW